MKDAGEQNERGAACGEHPTPLKPPRLTGTEAEGIRNYDINGHILTEGGSLEPPNITALPVITLGDGQLRDVADEVIQAIRTAGKAEPLLYVRGDRLARIIVDSEGCLKPGFVGAEAIPEIMSRAADFIRIRVHNKGDSSSVGVFPPESLAKAIANRGRWPFPKLRGIVEIPVLRKDGTILDKPGYDPASELYYHPCGPIPKIHDTPTREDAENAAGFLLDVLSDFPFQDEASRDNALGLLLTAAVKEFVGIAPIALIDAPTRGTGKTRLAQLASIVSSGRELPLSPEVRDDEEWRKKITSLLIADRPVVILDNVERTLCSGQLAAVLTTSEWADRILGKSEVLHLHSRAVWIATGNNIRVGGDIGRRSYWIRLNANLPRPWLRDSRDFKRELPAWATRHRAEMVVALLTMARAWFLDGRSSWSGRLLGSYETWSRVVGGILEYCGIKKFLTNLEELYDQADEDLAEWSVFLGAIFETFGANTAFSTKTLIERISGESASIYGNEGHNFLKIALPESLGDMKERGFSKRLGLAMKKRKDQIFEVEKGFIKLKEALPDRHQKQSRWQLIMISAGNAVEKSTAGSAGCAGCSNGHSRNEKTFSTKSPREEKTFSDSFREGAAELPAHPAHPAKEEPFVFEDGPGKRAPMRGESQKDGGTRDGETQAE
jgi:hypothetical protein